ncbi:MAG: 4'-phosphopantetheinyl transferase superfamily protein [Prevotellaceae bacterium]|jgi:phosphopantetheine--protein transferase-like protein|nr:4'-phosphopantetheinyl transferase superfamily protein [Prevotellaceae bacterium]
METLIFRTKEGATVAIDNLPAIDPQSSAGNHKRQCEKIAAHKVLEKLLNTKTEIMHDPYGKPFLKDNTLKISISHSKTKIALIIHATKNVGIDVENISPKILKLASRFLSDKELAQIRQSAENYTIAWAAKEAAFKIAGKAAVDFRKSLEIEKIEKGDMENKIILKFLEDGKVLNFYYKILNNNVLVWGMD